MIIYFLGKPSDKKINKKEKLINIIIINIIIKYQSNAKYHRKEVQPEKELNASREKPFASGKGTNII